MQTRSLLLSIAVASCLAAAGASAAEPTAPDTSEWSCSKCPFDKGYRAAAELGAGYLDESSAKFGDYTGLDEEGGYVVANAAGTYTADSGYRMSYELTDLGLESRAVRLEGGQPARYEYELGYDRVPHYLWDTTESVFGGAGSLDLTLPPNWVYASSTGGMTALDDSLRRRDVGFDRDRYVAAGKYYWGPNLVFGLDYRRDEREGIRTQFATLGNQSSQLLIPLDDATDRVTATIRFQAEKWFAEVGYNGSFYDTRAAALGWDNPYTPIVAGGDRGRMALAPDNGYNEIAFSAGMYGLPWNSTLAFNFATGRGTQETDFLPYTVNPDVATLPLPMSNLHGEVDVLSADLTFTSRPLDRLGLRGSLTYDERDNGSRQAAFDSQVFTDVFPLTGAPVNPSYGFERFRALGSADWQVYDDLSVGVGGEYRQLERTGTALEVKQEDLLDGWGRAEFRPSGYLGIVIRAGAKERTPDRYSTAVAEDHGQNPLMRKFHMAHLYRGYGELVANVSFGALPLTLSASGFYADDSYTKSDLGLVSGIDRRYGVDLNWAISEQLSAYVSGGQDKISSKQKGSSTFSSPDWKGQVEDSFYTVGAGATATFGEDLRLDVGYTYAEGDSRTTIQGAGAGRFPAVRSELSSFRADFTYDLSERTDVVLSLWHERFSSEDWALQGIGPATLPSVLSLGADPYDYSVNYVTASVRYYFGPRRLEVE
jgi:MtrB/PioB family decaheme-associated outer membrane protein